MSTGTSTIENRSSISMAPITPVLTLASLARVGPCVVYVGECQQSGGRILNRAMARVCGFGTFLARASAG